MFAQAPLSPTHHLSPEEWRLTMSNLASTFCHIHQSRPGGHMILLAQEPWVAQLFMRANTLRPNS